MASIRLPQNSKIWWKIGGHRGPVGLCTCIIPGGQGFESHRCWVPSVFSAIGQIEREERGGDGKWRLNSKHRFQVDMWRHLTKLSNINKLWRIEIQILDGLKKVVHYWLLIFKIKIRWKINFKQIISPKKKLFMVLVLVKLLAHF